MTSNVAELSTGDLLLVDMLEEMLDPDTSEGTQRGFMIASSILHPKSVGELNLNITHPFDSPVIEPHYIEATDDIKGVTKGIRIVNELVTASEAFHKGLIKFVEENAKLPYK